MALLTQHGRARLEHSRHSTTVRVMTIGTIFRNGSMLVHEGTSFLGVTGVAGVIHAVFFCQLRTRRTMHVMAIRAGHLSLWNRVMRWPIDLVALLFVARETELGLLGLG